MTLISRASAVSLLAALTTAAPVLVAPMPRTFEQPARPNALTELYDDQCASCHGATLAGGRAASLLDDTWTYGGDDRSLMHSIREGRPEADMPAFKGLLSDAQMRALVVFIREAALRARGTPAERATPMVNRVIKSERHAFEVQTVSEGLETPWAIAFLPDGRMLVTERPGRLRMIENGKLLPEPIGGTPAVWSHQDGGLFDVELHPDYARNGWIYLSYSEQGDAPSGNTAFTGTPPNSPSMTVIIRGRVRDGKWVDQETLYRAAPELYWNNNSHYGSRFIFDRQGHLFYSIGDRGRQDDAQDLSLPNGKIHRVTDAGKIPRDNPFSNRRGALGSIWSYGNRNPQGLAWHPVTGTLWSTEHGPRGGDELNIIERGRNYGWPVISYGLLDGGLATESTAKEGMEQPIAQWTPSPGVCPIVFYTGNRFPNWKNDLFLGSMGHEELRRLVLNGDKVLKQEVLFRGIGRVRDIVIGPDGYLYLALANPGASLSSTTPGRIVRLVPVQSRTDVR